MSLLQAIILGIIQGATEFIPISSSGHLVIVPWLLGWEPSGLMFDTVLHLGTLLAVIAYFWHDWWTLLRAWVHGQMHWDWSDPNARLGWLLVLASIPAALAGALFEGFFESLFAAPAWVGFFLLVTAAILAASEFLGRRFRELSDVRWLDALLIGLAQAVAIAPGISRSGATMSAGLGRGLERPAAARFSFLMSAPVILGAGLMQLLDLFDAPDPVAQVPALVAGLAAAAISGYLCIWGLLRYLQRGKLYPFAIYCALAGTLVLIVALV